jgi:hypothetical protein
MYLPASTRDSLSLLMSNSDKSSGSLSLSSFVGWFCCHHYLGLDGSKQQQLANFVLVPPCLPLGHFVANLHCAPFKLFDHCAWFKIEDFVQLATTTGIVEKWKAIVFAIVL